LKIKAWSFAVQSSQIQSVYGRLDQPEGDMGRCGIENKGVELCYAKLPNPIRYADWINRRATWGVAELKKAWSFATQSS